MAAAVAGVIVSHVVSSFINALFKNNARHYKAGPEGNLEVFLNTLSNDFVNRVENVIRAAFSEQALQDVKRDVTSAATSLRTYAATSGKDTFHLDTATGAILNARSKLIVECENIFSFKQRNEVHKIKDPSHFGKMIAINSKALEAAMSALQAIAALDITILSSRAEKYAGLNKEIVQRITEYTALADRLKKIYKGTQPLRTTLFTSIDNEHHFPEKNGFTVHYQVSCYQDGIEIDKRLLHGFALTHEKDQRKRAIYLEMQGKVSGESARLLASADNYTKGEGNLDEAITIWSSIKEHFIKP